MKDALQRHRFEVTIQCEGGRVKHVCAAHEKAEAIERMMRSYAKFNPELINMKHLGALPAKLRS
jgi:hypothetical protein